MLHSCCVIVQLPVFESMGNRPVPLQQLSEEPSPPVKAGYRDTYSTSVEMESLSEANEDNMWEKTYTQCGIRANRPTCRRFKPRINALFCCFIACVLVVIITLLLYMCASGKIAPVNSSDQDVHYNVSIINNTKDVINLRET